MAGNQFPRANRLKRRRLIRPLFERRSGQYESIRTGVVLIRWRKVECEMVGSPVSFQAGFAPGGRMRTKVERNRVRRIMREVFRTNRDHLHDVMADQNSCLTMMFVFHGAEATAETDIVQDLPAALQALKSRLTAPHEQSARPEL